MTDFCCTDNLKTLTGLEPYLLLNLNRHIRYTLTRFRFGVSDIKVHRSRFKVYNVNDLKCPLCLSAVDSEVHFVLCCPAFDDLRYEFIEPKYFNNPCEFQLALLLATQNERALKNLALFVYKAFCRERERGKKEKKERCGRTLFKLNRWKQENKKVEVLFFNCFHFFHLFLVGFSFLFCVSFCFVLPHVSLGAGSWFFFYRLKRSFFIWHYSCSFVQWTE